MEHHTHINEDAEKMGPETSHPKITRPKLPKFGSSTLGHHHRHKTDPGQASEIKHLMEEIKKWKDGGGVFDISPLRTMVVKPQSALKAHSTQTSPRASPPPGSPNTWQISSGLNRSRSLKLLTDKLKSPRGGTGTITNSQNIQGNRCLKSKNSDSAECDTESMFPEHYTGDERSDNEIGIVDKETDKTIITEPILEKDEKEYEDEKGSLSLGDTGGTPESVCPQGDNKVKHIQSFKDMGANGDERINLSDSDVPVTHISTYTLHPIDRNSEFLRLRQTAPPKRHHGYAAGLSMPKPQIPYIYTTHTNDTKETVDDSVIKKPNKLDLSGLVGVRKLSGSNFDYKNGCARDDGALDLARHSLFRTPSTESPTSLPEHESRLLGSKSVSLENVSTGYDSEVLEQSEGHKSNDFISSKEGVVEEKKQEFEVSESDTEIQDKCNGQSPIQKSKSDPSGSKCFDMPCVINLSQSSPLLQENDPQSCLSENVEIDTKVIIDVFNAEQVELETQDWDVVNNNENQSELNNLGSTVDRPSVSRTDVLTSSSVSEDVIFSPQSDLSEPFEDPMTHSPVLGRLQRYDSGSMSPVNEDGCEGVQITSSVYFDSCKSLSPPVSYSPTEELERQQNLLSVPSPKRHISRSASSASVLQRDRKFSGNHKGKDAVRKHSLTTGDDVSVSEIKTMDFLPIGELGNVLATSMPSVWQIERHASVSPEQEAQYKKDKRYHIVEELYRNEREYVDALKMLKERYMDPLKTVSGIDERVVDNIFYMIPEILTHHQIYLEFLNQTWTRWNTDTSTVGDLIQKTFSGQTVQDSYLSFVENYKISGKVIENALQTKSSVQKFVEQCQKESGSKLSLKDLIVRPIQRIPRYELLIQRLLVNTPGDHPDYNLLHEAEKVMHEFARKIGSLNEIHSEDGQQETLKKLELLLMTDLAVPERAYLKHDMVSIQNKKDQCCIWMFSDLIIISSVKRKSGPVTRKVSIILKSPSSQDFAESVKHKVWLKVGLDDIEVLKSQCSMKRSATMDKEQLEEDLDLLEMIQDLTNKLNCSHSGIDDVIKEMNLSLKKHLTEHNVRTSMLDTNKMELLVTTQEGVLNLEVNFISGEKRTSWETTFLDAKQKLSLLSDERAVEFLQLLQITKTRAGMQFSCAAPIDGVNSSGYRDVWVCNSDGYVGHMCLLSLQPEPIVTLNTPVPGCNARILCIAAVPAYASPRRKRSLTKYKVPSGPTMDGSHPRISVEEVDSAINEEPVFQGENLDMPDTVSENGYQSDSSSSDETDDDFISSRKPIAEEFEVKRAPSSQIMPTSPDLCTATAASSLTQDPLKSTMWLGTEDGCISIFQCMDNIKTTKNKLKIQLGYPIYCIVYLDNKVFVALSNGDLNVYRRDRDGCWDMENPYTRAIGSVTAPIMKMLPVAGKLWCGHQNNICVINPLTLSIEKTFPVQQDSNRCVQCIVNAGHGVWIASQQSFKVLLYHATTYEFLLEISIAQAVNQKLQSTDDIIRQHKAACLRITALLVCKDLLWIGTSAGVILTVPMPKITSTTIRGSLSVPNVTGLVYGHTGHVRFLTCVEMANSNIPPSHSDVTSRTDKANNNNADTPPLPKDIKRRSSVATMTAALATRMLVITGGDGYEDFRTNVVNESAGKDDSTNHLLLWQV